MSDETDGREEEGLEKLPSDSEILLKLKRLQEFELDKTGPSYRPC